MAGFVAPSTVLNPTAGQAATAAWGDAVNDATAYLATNKAHARVYNSANIALSTATLTALTFDSERYDVGSCHSTVTNTSRLTVPTGEAGVFGIGGHVRFAANAAGYRALVLKVNNTTSIAETDAISLGAGDVIHLSIYTEYVLAAADYVELLAYQNSGGSLNVVASSALSPEFFFRWVST